MEQINLKNQKQILIYTAYISTIILIFFLLLKYIIPFFMPFLVGFLISIILKPISRAICKKSNLNCKICGTLVVVISYILIIFLVCLIGSKIIEAIQSFYGSSNSIYENYILPYIFKINELTISIVSQILPNLTEQTNEIIKIATSGLNQAIATLSHSIIIWIAKIGISIPNFFIGLIFAIMSSIFISSDYNNIALNITKFLPKKQKALVFQTKMYTIKTITKYIKAYLILMFLTFIELIFGFLIIGIENPIGIAALISICDAIPLIGSGIIILPWCLILLSIGNIKLGLELIILNLIVGILHSFLEPKILGNQLGMHPLVTLISVYIGIKLFGILGVIFIPIIIQIALSLYKNRNQENLI